MNLETYLVTAAALVWICSLWWRMNHWRNTALSLNAELELAKSQLLAVQVEVPMTRNQRHAVDRELERQRRRHETHEMMRRGSFGKKRRSSKKGKR
jgi:membrane protein YdbS with pleckstrin-like domain